MMVTGLICVNKFIIFSLFVFLSGFVFSDDCARDDYIVFYKSEYNNEGGRYYNEMSYRLINELQSRCLYSVIDKSISPRLIGGKENKIVIDVVYSSSQKKNGSCILDHATFMKESLVFSKVELAEFIYLEGIVHEFIAGDDFKKEFSAKFGVVDFYAFSFIKSDVKDYILSTFADGVIYDISIEISDGALKITEIEKSPNINI